jgi:uncharacterized protein
MDQRVSFVTLAVSDLGASRRFYADGLGWEPEFEGDDVLMFRVADKVVLSLWDEHAFAEEVGGMPSRGAVPPITLAHNLRTRDGVDRCLEQARVAGAEHVGEAAEREWGGYTGYFADPDGYRWEVAWNPSDLGESVLP